MRCAAGLQRSGLHVPLRWRAAHGLWFSVQAVCVYRRGPLVRWRAAHCRRVVLSSVVLGVWSLERMACAASFHSQPLSACQHKALAFGRLQVVAVKLGFLSVLALSRLHAAALITQWIQAPFRLSRGLTLQSRGHAPASRVMPLTSNVRPHTRGAPLLCESSPAGRSSVGTFSSQCFSQRCRTMPSLSITKATHELEEDGHG